MLLYIVCLCKALCTKIIKYIATMAQGLSDAQLLCCPEPLEELFIHRGRRDLIATQAGKEFLYFDLCTKLEGKGFSNF